MIKKIYRNFFYGLFPRVCPLCQADLKNEHQTKNKQLNCLCEKCRLDLLQLTGLKRFYVKVDQLLSGQKLGNFFYFWNFENEIEFLIKKYKFGKNYRLADLFAEFAFLSLRNFNILDSGGRLPAWNLVCAVPSAPSSIRNKRFNHGQMLAKAISKKVKVPYSDNILFAIRDRKSQSDLNKSQRRKNISGAFSADKIKVKNSKILLIDDITTTGATIAECCKTLYNSSAMQVDVLTLAKRELYEV